MLIARAVTPVGISYGIVEGDDFRTMHGDPFGEIELATGSFSLSEVKLIAPVNPRGFFIVLDGFVRPTPPGGDPVPGRDVHFNGDWVIPEGVEKPTTDPLLYPKMVHQPCSVDDEMYWPKDYPGPVLMEPELAVVIAKKVKGLAAADAMDAVLGFTCFNDLTLGAYLPRRPAVAHLKGGDTFQSKLADTAASVGPWIRTGLTDADLDRGLAIEGRINGELKCTGNARNRKWTIGHVVSYACRYRTLYPGDVIALGTPATPPEVKPGDVMEVVMEGIGTLRNTLR